MGMHALWDRLFLVTLGFLIAGCVSARMTTIGSFTSSTGHFSVTVPNGSMIESTSTGAGPFAAATIHTFLDDEPNGARFVVIYGDANPAFVASISTEAALDQFEAANVTATHGQQVAERQLMISGLPGREQRIVGPGGGYVFRTVLVGDRLYSFSVKGSDVALAEAQVSVFFDSFTITP